MALILSATGTKITNPDAKTIFIRPATLPAYNGRMIFKDKADSISDLSSYGLTGAVSGDVIWLPDGVQVNRVGGINLNKLPTAAFSFYSIYRLIASGTTEFYPLHNFSAYTSPGIAGEAIMERTPRGSIAEEYGALKYTNKDGAQGALPSTADPDLSRPKVGEFVFRMGVLDPVNYQYRLYTGKNGKLTVDSVSASTDIAARNLTRTFQVGICSTYSFTGLSSSGVVNEIGFFDNTALADRQAAALYEKLRVEALTRGISI
ncbi:hypothetical protein [Winslowiella arboricola]|uniref:hypothetical protein n=1 Tax=Winslowiella arboricola TaxID=2978220 RepID=UPI00225E5DEE|nr:hypothetical protein [Winslowiella arboricola]MCU5775217.1 hypothetical protein [Winslowiella arboricola]